jgi:hypothetical protein
MSFDVYSLTRRLRRIGLYAPLYRAAKMLRGTARAEQAAATRLRDDFDYICADLRPLAKNAGKRVLIGGWSSFIAATVQLPIVAAFIRAGYSPVVILPSRADRLAIELYRQAGVDHFEFWTELAPARKSVRPQDIADIRTTDDALAIEQDGIRVGRYALSTMMRNLRRGRFDFTDAADRNLLQGWLQRSEDAVAFADTILERWRPHALLLNDQGYIPLGPLFERALARGIAAYTWNASHRDDAIILKRYDSNNKDDHPTSLSDDSWNSLVARPWHDSDWRRLFNEISHGYRSGQWYAEVGTQFDKTFPERAALMARLNLDPSRRTVLVFPHIFWDGTFFWGDDLFEDYESFFVETMKVAYRTPTVNWIVKIHPANLVKSRRDGVKGPLGEWQALESLGPVPSHIHVLDATTDISTLSLFELGDVCVTVRGTVGLESACFGLATITAGTGRYDHLGFTIDPASTEEFLDMVGKADQIEKPSPDAIERARRYAHGILLERPTPYKCIRFSFAKDAVASLQIKIDRDLTLITSPEVRAMAEYIQSGKEDFLQAP